MYVSSQWWLYSASSPLVTKAFVTKLKRQAASARMYLNLLAFSPVYMKYLMTILYRKIFQLKALSSIHVGTFPTFRGRHSSPSFIFGSRRVDTRIVPRCRGLGSNRCFHNEASYMQYNLPLMDRNDKITSLSWPGHRLFWSLSPQLLSF